MVTKHSGYPAALAYMKLFKAIFGSYLNLVVHVARSTLVFMIVLACIFIARKLVPRLFPPADYPSEALHLVDSYAALLGTVGYVVWLSLDMYFLFKERLLKSQEKEERNGEF